MALGQRKSQQQDEPWIARDEIVRGPGHPYDRRLNTIFDEAGIDRWVQGRCKRFYAKAARPGIPPGVYLRMLMIGYVEGLDSARGIAWRCADSLVLRAFRGYGLTDPTPDHSTLSVIRNRIDVETHGEIFGWILERLEEHGLIKGKTIGVDATTLEAHAALRSLVRRSPIRRSSRRWRRNPVSRRRLGRIWHGWTGSDKARVRTRTGTTPTIPTPRSRR